MANTKLWNGMAYENILRGLVFTKKKHVVVVYSLNASNIADYHNCKCFHKGSD